MKRLVLAVIVLMTFKPPVFLPLITEAWISIGTNRAVAFLAMLGIIIGVASVVLMVAIGLGSQQKIERAISSLGDNLLVVYPGNNDPQGLHINTEIAKFSTSDVNRIAELPSVEAAAYITAKATPKVLSNFSSTTAEVGGTIPEYFTLRNWVFGDGDSFTDADVHLNKRVAVIGSTVADKLFHEQNPLGQTITIGEKKQGFLIIGILEPKGPDLNGEDQDNAIYIPATTYQNFFDTYNPLSIAKIFVKVVSRQQMEDTADAITTILRERQKIPETLANNFSVKNIASITKIASDNAATFSLLLGSIASISLLVGSIGIMNIMLVTVSERTREIGIRKAIGATKRQIMIQFLLEAVIISTLGSVVGLVIGLGGGLGAQMWFKIPVAYSMWAVGMALVMAGAIGVASGLYPAWKASRMQPIDALRTVG